MPTAMPPRVRMVRRVTIIAMSLLSSMRVEPRGGRADFQESSGCNATALDLLVHDLDASPDGPTLAGEPLAGAVAEGLQELEPEELLFADEEQVGEGVGHGEGNGVAPEAREGGGDDLGRVAVDRAEAR